MRSHVEAIDMTCTEPSDGPLGYSRSCEGSETVRAECEPGEVATGGSTSGGDTYNSSGGGNYQYVTMSVARDRPDPAGGTPTGWAADAGASGSSSRPDDSVEPPVPPALELTVYVVCAS